MKKIYNIFAAAVMASLFAASCATEELPTINEGKVPMTIFACDGNAAPETSTVLYLDKETKEVRVCFTSEDKLYVYGQKEDDIKGVQFKAESTGRLQECTFSTANWPEGYTPIYAVATTSTDAVKQSCTADGKITMLVDNSVQKYKWSGSYAVNTTGHVGTVEDGVTKLKNVCGLIGFRVSNPDITKIIVKGNGDETLGGWVKVDYAKLISGDADFYTTVDNDVKFVELKVNDYLDNNKEKLTNGCFPNDTSFFISLLPGAYSSGLSFTLFNSKGESAVRNIPAALPIARSQIRQFESPLDSGLEFKGAEMPDELTFVLVDAGVPWPFRESTAGKTAQTASGETYTYPYADPVSGYGADFPFMLCNSKGTEGDAYSYGTGFLTMKSVGDWIKLPAIEGRVLVSLVISHSNSSTTRKFTVGSEVGKDDYLSEVKIVSGDTAYVAWNANAAKKPEIGKAAYINSNSSSFKMSKVVAVYAKAFPKSETIVLDCTDAANFRYLKDGVSTQLPNVGHSQVLTECDFWLDGKEEYIFHGTVQRWGSENLNADKNSPVKLPTIEGYKLSNVNIASYSQSAKTIKLTDGTKDLASITLLRADGYNDMVIDDTQAEGNDRYLVSASELGVKFTLTYNLIK